MARVNRKKRARKVAPDSLTDFWNRGLPPPESAFEPNVDTHCEIVGLYFMDEGEISGRTHPYREEWSAAMGASNAPAPKPQVPPART